MIETFLSWLLDLIIPDYVMCPTCTGSGCIECAYTGEIRDAKIPAKAAPSIEHSKKAGYGE